jgi:hypothetical protein
VVKENNSIAREKQKKYYDHGTKLVTFQPGDLIYLREMAKSKRGCPKFRIRWKGPYEVMRCLSDLHYRVKLSRGKEIVFNVNKMKRCFRKTTVRPATGQRGKGDLPETKHDTLEVYGTRYPTRDSPTALLAAPEMESTEELRRDRIWEPHHRSRCRTSNCGEVDAGEDGKTTSRYSLRNRSDVGLRDLGVSPHMSKGDGGGMRLEHLDAEAANPGTTPNATEGVEMSLIRTGMVAIFQDTTCGPFREGSFRFMVELLFYFVAFVVSREW